MNDKFEILFTTVPGYEHLVADIEFGGQRLCRLSKEGGVMEIEFHSDLYVMTKSPSMKFDLARFREMLKRAEDALKRRP